MTRRQIHRAALNGRPSCGQPGAVLISNSGAGVTCPACIKAETPDREAQERGIREAAARFRARHEQRECLPDRFVTMMPYRQPNEDERSVVNHVSRWGSDGYPVRRLVTGRWTWEYRSLSAPTLYATKREATASFERYCDMISDWMAFESYVRALENRQQHT